MIKITEETINSRLKMMGKAADGSTKVCQVHEKRLTRSNIKGDEPKWIMSVGEDEVTLILRVSCGHSKSPCFDRFTAALALKDENGAWMATTPDYKESRIAPEVVEALTAPVKVPSQLASVS